MRRAYLIRSSPVSPQLTSVPQPAFQVYISDPPNHSHHGTYLSRNGRTFRVDHPQPLQTGDILTFGKTVHRGGQVCCVFIVLLESAYLILVYILLDL